MDESLGLKVYQSIFLSLFIKKEEIVLSWRIVLLSATWLASGKTLNRSESACLQVLAAMAADR